MIEGWGILYLFFFAGASRGHVLLTAVVFGARSANA